MKKFISTLTIACVALFIPSIAVAQVTATILEQELTPSVTDTDDYREYVSVSYTIKVTGAENHTLRVEIPWLDINNKQVYTNIDEGEKAISTGTYYMESNTDTIVGWCGHYHDSFWLKPGLQKLNGTIRLFDETLGKYIPLTGAKKHTFSYTSEKKGQGVQITNCYLEHNQYVNGNKVMYVRYSVDMNWMKNKNVKCDISLFKANGSPIYCYNGKADKNVNTFTPTYTFTTWSDQWAWFSYASMNMPKGKTNCYALIRFYDAKTGALLAKSQKLEFYLTR